MAMLQKYVIALKFKLLWASLSQDFSPMEYCHCYSGPEFQDCHTIQLAVQKGLAAVRVHRTVRRVRAISDTGGENWGTEVPSCLGLVLL